MRTYVVAWNAFSQLFWSALHCFGSVFPRSLTTIKRAYTGRNHKQKCTAHIHGHTETDTTGFSCFYRFWYISHPLDLPGIYVGFSLSTKFRIPWTVNQMHFSFYFIKPNQFVICSCRCLLLLLLDCCFLRHCSLNTTARILIFSIALTWLICCGSATICL